MPSIPSALTIGLLTTGVSLTGDAFAMESLRASTLIAAGTMLEAATSLDKLAKGCLDNDSRSKIEGLLGQLQSTQGSMVASITKLEKQVAVSMEGNGRCDGGFHSVIEGTDTRIRQTKATFSKVFSLYLDLMKTNRRNLLNGELAFASSGGDQGKCINAGVGDTYAAEDNMLQVFPAMDGVLGRITYEQERLEDYRVQMVALEARCASSASLEIIPQGSPVSRGYAAAEIPSGTNPAKESTITGKIRKAESEQAKSPFKLPTSRAGNVENQPRGEDIETALNRGSRVTKQETTRQDVLKAESLDETLIAPSRGEIGVLGKPQLRLSVGEEGEEGSGVTSADNAQMGNIAASILAESRKDNSKPSRGKKSHELAEEQKQSSHVKDSVESADSLPSSSRSTDAVSQAKVSNAVSTTISETAVADKSKDIKSTATEDSILSRIFSLLKINGGSANNADPSPDSSGGNVSSSNVPIELEDSLFERVKSRYKSTPAFRMSRIKKSGFQKMERPTHRH